MPESSPVLLGANMVGRALTDTKFYEQVPEFTPFKSKLAAMKIKVDAGRGCGGCSKRRIQGNLFVEFVVTLNAMNADAITRIKRYFGAEKMMLNSVNPVTRQVSLKII